MRITIRDLLLLVISWRDIEPNPAVLDEVDAKMSTRVYALNSVFPIVSGVFKFKHEK